MKSTSFVRLLFGFLALLFVSSALNAQIVKGSFTLPFEAQWGDVAMPPGQYTFDLDVTGRVPVLLHVGQTSTLSRFGFSESLSSSAKSQLVMAHVGDKWMVNAVYIASINKAFWFTVPEKYAVSHRVIANSEPTENVKFVSVTVNGK